MTLGVIDDFVSHYKVASTKTKTIYNSYDIALFKSRASEDIREFLTLPGNFIVSVGRLTHKRPSYTHSRFC